MGETRYEAFLVNRMLQAMGRMGINRPYPVIIIFLVIAISLGLNLPRLHFSHNELHYFSEDSDFMRQVNLIEGQTGGFRALEILIDTQQKQGILDRKLLETMEQLETYLNSQTNAEGQAYVGRTRSLVDVIKENACVTTNQDRSDCLLPEDQPALLVQFDHIHRIVPEVLGKYTDTDLRTGRLTAMMYWRDAADDVDFIGRVREYATTLFGSGTNVVTTGIVAINSGIIHAMTRSLAIGYSTGLLLITALMIVAIGDIRIGLLAMIPNMMPIVFGLGVMGFLDIPLNTYNLIGGSIVIGLAVDDTIHFFHNFRRYYLRSGDIHYAVKETLGSAGRALLTTTLILVASFWMRLFSDLKVIADFGLVLGIALLVAFLADVLLAPALLRIFYSKRKKDQLIQGAQTIRLL
jgi:predicted RND superfamily exporter protein